MIENLITSKTKRDLLALVLLNPEKEYYLRQVSRSISQNPSLISSELKKLTAVGLINSRRHGSIIYYSVNKKSSIYPELKSIFVKMYAFSGIIKKALSVYGSRLKFAFIYGSYARGEERQGSDIDLMIIGNVPLEKLHISLVGAEKILGLDINYTLYPPKELKTTKNGFVLHILKEKKIMLFGDENELERFAERG